MNETFDAKIRNALSLLMPEAPEKTEEVIATLTRLYDSRMPADPELDEIFNHWRGEMVTKGFNSPSTANAIDDKAKQRLLAWRDEARQEARQQMVDYYAKEFRKGYKGILPKEVVEDSIAWLQKEADRQAQLKNKGEKS